MNAVEVEQEGWWNDTGDVYTWPIRVGEWGAKVECHGENPAEAQQLALRLAWLFAGDDTHLNSADILPPVACPIVIDIPGAGLKRAERIGYVYHRGDQMEYLLDDGSKINGRFRWTYP